MIRSESSIYLLLAKVFEQKELNKTNVGWVEKKCSSQNLTMKTQKNIKNTKVQEYVITKNTQHRHTRKRGNIMYIK